MDVYRHRANYNCCWPEAGHFSRYICLNYLLLVRVKHLELGSKLSDL